MLGNFQFKDDHWECWEIPTKIGTVDLQVDSVSIDLSTLPMKTQAIFNQIDLINANARQYLEQNVPEDELSKFGVLIEPSILLSDENNEGHFTLFLYLFK